MISNMSKEQIIQNALDEYKAKRKQISIDAITGHLDRMEYVEMEHMLRELFSKVYEQAINNI